MKWAGRRYDTAECVEITIENGVIQLIEGIPNNDGLAWISPGWIDLQVNGFAGFDLNGESISSEDIVGLTKAMFACGVTGYCPTVITGSNERIRIALAAIRKACEQSTELNEAICGVHLEGPYLSEEDGPRGAHDRAFIRDPDEAEFACWQEEAGGRIKLVTIAPERSGAIEFIRKLTNSGIALSIGHTNATTSQLEEAIKAGATLSTHLGNGAHPVLARHPNYIWDQLSSNELQAMLIADGHHLPLNVLKVMIRAKSKGFILVSDCVKFGGMLPGKYKSLIGEEVELLPNGRLQTLANSAILAGSAQSLDRGIEYVVGQVGIPLSDAIDAVTLRPAEAIGIEVGRLVQGAVGNLTLFSYPNEEGCLHIQETVLRGKTVYKRG